MNYNENFSFKELEHLPLKATYPIEIGKRKIEPGEIIVKFDNIMLSNFREIQQSVSANGGWDNRGLVFWDKTKEVQLSFTQGVFNKTQFALVSGAGLVEKEKGSISITKRENLESDVDSNIELKEIPSGNLFVYDVESGQPIEFIKSSEKILHINEPYKDVIVDYEYMYQNKADSLIIGKKVLKGYIQLEGRTKIKEDSTGQVRTGIIKIPKLKIVSDLSMRLGREATPVAGSFTAVALPTGERGNTKVMEILFLDDDIDSDIR